MKDIIRGLYEKLGNEQSSRLDKMNAANCLIGIKRRQNPDDEHLYYLTKQLIVNYIEGISDRKSSNYDEINTDRIIKFVEPFRINDRLQLLKLALRKLRNNQYEDEAHEMEKVISTLELPWTWEHYRFRRPFKLLRV